MFFVLSKVLWFFANPANFLIAATLLAALLAYVGRVGVPRTQGGGTPPLRMARRFALLGSLLLALAGFSPLGTLLLRPLEDRFPTPDLAAIDPAGIIVLGGPIDQEIGAPRGDVHLGEGAERLTAAVTLSRRFPQAKLVYSGGSNNLIKNVPPEADAARRLWIDLGVPAGRILVEDKSRNTDENARFTHDLLDPKPGTSYLLVTSAYHMPRAVGLFRKASFSVIPYPVDYRTRGDLSDLTPMYLANICLTNIDIAAREWIGLVAYRLSGRTDTFFPAP